VPLDFQAQSSQPDFVRKVLNANKLRQQDSCQRGRDSPIARKVGLAPMLTIVLIESNIRTGRAGGLSPGAVQQRGCPTAKNSQRPAVAARQREAGCGGLRAGFGDTVRVEARCECPMRVPDAQAKPRTAVTLDQAAGFSPALMKISEIEASIVRHMASRSRSSSSIPNGSSVCSATVSSPGMK
jgi:hypothetical protein